MWGSMKTMLHERWGNYSILGGTPGLLLMREEGVAGFRGEQVIPDAGAIQEVVYSCATECCSRRVVLRAISHPQRPPSSPLILPTMLLRHLLPRCTISLLQLFVRDGRATPGSAHLLHLGRGNISSCKLDEAISWTALKLEAAP